MSIKVQQGYLYISKESKVAHTKEKETWIFIRCRLGNNEPNSILLYTI